MDYIRQAARERWERDYNWFQTQKKSDTSTATNDEMSVAELNAERDTYDSDAIQSAWQFMGIGG